MYCQHAKWSTSFFLFFFFLHVGASHSLIRPFPLLFLPSFFGFIQILWTVFKMNIQNVRMSVFFWRRIIDFVITKTKRFFYFPPLILKATKYIFTFLLRFSCRLTLCVLYFLFVRINVNSITRIESSIFFLGAKFAISTYKGGKNRS